MTESCARSPQVSGYMFRSRKARQTSSGTPGSTWLCVPQRKQRNTRVVSVPSAGLFATTAGQALQIRRSSPGIATGGGPDGAKEKTGRAPSRPERRRSFRSTAHCHETLTAGAGADRP